MLIAPINDVLTKVVYEKAGFPPPPQANGDEFSSPDQVADTFLTDARKEAIRQRTGQDLTGKWDVIQNPEDTLRKFGFDHSMALL